MCKEGNEFRNGLRAIERPVWDDVGEWLHRNWAVFYTVILYAYKRPHTFQEFCENGLVVFFKYFGSKKRLFERLELGCAKMVGTGVGSTNVGVPVRDMMPDSFSSLWKEEEGRAKQRLGNELLGVVGYIIAVSIDGTADIVYFPRIACLTRSTREQVTVMVDWEKRLWEHCMMLKLTAIWGRLE